MVKWIQSVRTAGISDLNFLSHFRLKWKKKKKKKKKKKMKIMCFIKIAIIIIAICSPLPRLKFPFIYMTKYVRKISPPRASWVKGETYFFKNFYETHSILHFNWKWEGEFKSDIPNTDCIHWTIISHQCCVFVILIHEIFPKEKRN